MQKLRRYRVRYSWLPAGVGPDDYEGSDLEKRDEDVELPEPQDGYGPDIRDVEEALRERVPDGAQPMFLRFLD